MTCVKIAKKKCNAFKYGICIFVSFRFLTILVVLVSKYHFQSHVIDANVRANRTISRKHAETRVRPVHFPRPSSRPTCTSWHADGEMVCFKRSKSFHGMRPRRISGYLRVSLGGPASGEPLEGKKKNRKKGIEKKTRSRAQANERVFCLVV